MKSSGSLARLNGHSHSGMSESSDESFGPFFIGPMAELKKPFLPLVVPKVSAALKVVSDRCSNSGVALSHHKRSSMESCRANTVNQMIGCLNNKQYFG